MAQVSKGRATPRAPTSTLIDRELAAEALRKRRAGKKPNDRELRALRQVERAEEEKQRWAYYSTIPLKHWRAMSGRATKVLNDQAARYGIPFAGPTIDLSAVVRALHGFLAANARKLVAVGDEDPLLAGVASPALEEYRREKVKLLRLDVQEREQVLLPRDRIHEGLSRIASVLRLAGDALQRQYGPDARQIIDEALDDAQREIDLLFDDGAGGDSDDQ